MGWEGGWFVLGGIGFGWYCVWVWGVKGNGPVIVFFWEGGGGTSQLKVTMAWVIVERVMVGS